MGPPKQVQISVVAGRYLIFDHNDIAIIRRHHDVCGVLTGTVPQSPTQNLFLGIPLELRPEDVAILAEAGVAAVRDEAQIQLALLRKPADPSRQHYVDSIKSKKRAVERALHGHLETKHSAAELSKDAGQAASQNAGLLDDARLLGSSREHDHPSPGTDASKVKAPSCSVCPTSVGNLPLAMRAAIAPQQCSPLHRHLHSRGFFMTPGLRFGAHFSVYPGDPFRYHAHFLANDYKWDEEIPLLEFVGAGRLSTAVKKGFLAGSEPSTSSDPSSETRVFCVEWAGM